MGEEKKENDKQHQEHQEQHRINIAFEPLPEPIPVDRNWISKLLQQHPNPNSKLKDKALVVAPMVDQSDLPFRLLCRDYGANLCYTPMMHTKLLCISAKYRQKFLGNFIEQDRPLIAQLCGSDPDMCLQAAKMVEPYVDGIDINCGCPQGIARRGNYGAFLLEQPDTILTLVRHLVKYLTKPLSVKVRLVPVSRQDFAPDGAVRTLSQSEYEERMAKASLQLYTQLVDAGIHLLTIHGRTRHQKGPETGHANWNIIRQAVDLLGQRIPIFANGSIENFNDVVECLKITNADGVMSSESILEYPPLFWEPPKSLLLQQQQEQQQLPTPDNDNSTTTSTTCTTSPRIVGRVQLALEYMKHCKLYPPDKGGQGSGLKCMRVHIHRFLDADLQNVSSKKNDNNIIDLRQQLGTTTSIEGLYQVIEAVQKRHAQMNHIVAQEQLSWYRRHRDELLPTNNTNQQQDDDETKLQQNVMNQESKQNDDDEEEECMIDIFGGQFSED